MAAPAPAVALSILAAIAYGRPIYVAFDLHRFEMLRGSAYLPAAEQSMVGVLGYFVLIVLSSCAIPALAGAAAGALRGRLRRG